MVATPTVVLVKQVSVMLVEFQADHAGELVPLWRESFEFGVGIVDPHPIAEQEK